MHEERGAGARVHGQGEVRRGHVRAERPHGHVPEVWFGGGCEAAVCGNGEEGCGFVECLAQGFCGAWALQ